MEPESVSTRRGMTSGQVHYDCQCGTKAARYQCITWQPGSTNKLPFLH